MIAKADFLVWLSNFYEDIVSNMINELNVYWFKDKMFWCLVFFLRTSKYSSYYFVLLKLYFLGPWLFFAPHLDEKLEFYKKWSKEPNPTYCNLLCKNYDIFCKIGSAQKYMLSGGQDCTH